MSHNLLLIQWVTRALSLNKFKNDPTKDAKWLEFQSERWHRKRGMGKLTFQYHWWPLWPLALQIPHVMSIFTVPFTIRSIFTYQKTDKNCRCDEYYIILNSKDVTFFFQWYGTIIFFKFTSFTTSSPWRSNHNEFSLSAPFCSFDKNAWPCVGGVTLTHTLPSYHVSCPAISFFKKCFFLQIYLRVY